MKKMLSLLIIVLMCVSMFSFAYAENSAVYEYEVQEDGTLIITGYHRYGSDRSIVIPEEIDGICVTAIGAEAFYNNDLESVTIPNGITMLYGNPFYLGGMNLQFVISKDHPTLALIDGVLFSKADKRLICFPGSKEAIKNYTVPNGIEIIADRAFYSTDLSTIVLPETLVSIGVESFRFCDNIVKLHIPDSVTHIGDDAFSDCDELDEINISMGLLTMGENPFRGTKITPSVPKNHPVFRSVDGALYNKKENKLIAFPLGEYITEFTVAKGTLSIGDYAFYSVGYLKSVKLPEGLIEIGDYAFEYCAMLNNVSIPKSVKTLGEYAFAGCEDMESISIPNGVVTIPDGLFSGCSLLEDISLPNSLRAIGNYAFANCGSFRLDSLSIPEGVETIGKNAFAKCSADSIYVPETIKQIGSGAFSDTGLTTMELPSNISSISDSLFAGCDHLESITIPNNVTAIGSKAFADCPLLQSVELPQGIQTIADDAFEGSNNVSLIVSSGSYSEEYAKAHKLDYGCPGDNDWLFQ